MLSVFITGASTGIGEACALTLDSYGFQVFAGVRKTTDADALRAKASDRLTPILIDVTQSESIQAGVEQIKQKLGEDGLHGLVNNAGISASGPLEFMPLNEIRRQLDVNLFGQIAVTQEVLPLLRQARGRIVNMSSLSGRFVFPFYGAYAMSKFGLEAFSDALRRELKPWGMHVSVIEPGSIATPIWDKGIALSDEIGQNLPEAAVHLYGKTLKRVRLGTTRMGKAGIPPEKVAEAVHHALCAKRPKTRYLVGRDAQITARLAWLLPDRIMDWLMQRSLG